MGGHAEKRGLPPFDVLVIGTAHRDPHPSLSK